MQGQELHSVIETIYSAGVERNLWSKAAESIQSLVGAHSVSLVIEDYRSHQHSYAFTNGMSPSQVEHYQREILPRDEIMVLYDTQPMVEPIITQELPEFSGSSYYSMLLLISLFQLVVT